MFRESKQVFLVTGTGWLQQADRNRQAGISTQEWRDGQAATGSWSSHVVAIPVIALTIQAEGTVVTVGGVLVLQGKIALVTGSGRGIGGRSRSDSQGPEPTWR